MHAPPPPEILHLHVEHSAAGRWLAAFVEPHGWIYGVELTALQEHYRAAQLTVPDERLIICNPTTLPPAGPEDHLHQAQLLDDLVRAFEADGCPEIAEQFRDLQREQGGPSAPTPPCN